MFLFAAPSLLLIALAILPAILLMIYIYKQDRLEQEPARMIISLATLGVVSTFLAMITETIGMAVLGNMFSESSVVYRLLLYFIVVGLSEEGFKYLVLKIGTWKSPEFNCKFDGVVYAVAVSLGFAVWENIKYVMTYGLTTALVRAVTAVPGHACFGVIMGAWYGLAKRKQQQGWDSASRLARFMAVLLPTIVHGIYDFIATSNASSIHFIVFVIIMFVVCFYTVKRQSADDKYHNDDQGEDLNIIDI